MNLNFEWEQRPYGVSVYIRDSEGKLNRIGGFRDLGEAETEILHRIQEAEGDE